MIVSRRWGLAVALAFAACSPDDQGGECASDDDCTRADARCLYDGARATTYCTTECGRDLDCPDTRLCRPVAEDPGLGSGAERALCIDKVRVCADAELCNGLDDDCNGRIDDDCEVLPCRAETQCGAFSCAAPAGADATVCAARPDGAPRSFYGACAGADDCPNGICEAGLCTPLCRPIREPDGTYAGDSDPDCAAVDLDGDGLVDADTICIEQVGPTDRPLRNVCQIRCEGPSGCPAPLSCVWRRLWPRLDDHAAVCSAVDPGLAELGAACPDNSVAGDATCQSGLCLFQTCTRFCEGTGDDCSDVGEGFVCDLNRQLFYQQPPSQVLVFDVSVCVPGDG